MGKQFKITLTKSVIGCTQTQRATVAALGLRKIRQSVTLADNAANRGQVLKVQHLVHVEVKG